jgi:hypothetical protein
MLFIYYLHKSSIIIENNLSADTVFNLNDHRTFYQLNKVRLIFKIVYKLDDRGSIPG